MPKGILVIPVDNVNEIAAKNCTPSKNFESLEMSDVLENIKILLNYVRKKKLKGASLISEDVRAVGGWASAHTNEYDLSSRKSSLQKIFGSNPTLHHRRILENPLPPYAALRAARQNFPETDVSFIRATLYDQIRTYFQNN